MKRFLSASALALILVGGLAACETRQAPTPVKVKQAAKAAEAANSINFSENAEIDNIKARLELTSQPGLLGYIVLINQAGQPVMYTTVKGKVTSGSKRLTAPQQVKFFGTNAGYSTVDAPSDEGTYGSSNPYIFFWTPQGQYIQWSDQYLYSDKPIRLTVQPLVVNLAPGNAVPAKAAPPPAVAPAPVPVTPPTQ